MKISWMLAVIMPFLLVACVSEDDNRYENTLKRLDYGCSGRSRIHRDAILLALKEAGGPDALSNPKIVIAEFYDTADTGKRHIVLGWISLKPAATGFFVKSSKGEAYYSFSPVDVEANNQAARKLVVFAASVFFKDQLPALIYDKNVTVTLARYGVPVSGEFPVEIIKVPENK